MLRDDWHQYGDATTFCDGRLERGHDPGGEEGGYEVDAEPHARRRPDLAHAVRTTTSSSSRLRGERSVLGLFAYDVHVVR
jgi:hypothetical protein